MSRRRVLLLLAPLLVGAAARLAFPQQPAGPPPADDKPFRRWLWEYQQRAYPLGFIPEGARLRALARIEELDARRGRGEQAAQGDIWQPLGPAPIQDGQLRSEAGRRPVSGRVADVAIDPGNRRHWLIGAAQGGIGETFDEGQTWQHRTDNMPSLAMGTIAFAPSNPGIVYAGTGEASYGGRTYFGAGLLRSTDGGTTWTVHHQDSFNNVSFSDIAVDPANAQILLAATTSGEAGLSGMFPATASARGIRKSVDGGTTWGLPELSGEATDLEVDPTDFRRQYAGIGWFGGEAGVNGVFRSLDAGDNWGRIAGPWEGLAGGVGRVELAIAPSDPRILYVSIQDARNGTPNDNQLLGLWRTDDAWELPAPVFTEIDNARGSTNDGRTPPTPGYCGPQCYYDHEILVDHANPNTLYAGGIPLWKCENCTSGTNARWTDVSAPADPQQSIHVDQHAMAWAGLPPRTATPSLAALAARPLIFEAHHGYAEAEALFLARGAGSSLLLRRDGGLDLVPAAEGPRQAVAVSLSFPGSNPQPDAAGQQQLPARVHYFLGDDPRHWRRNLRTYASVRYRGLYAGIDLRYYGTQEGLEYDFVLAPGADPEQIAIEFRGADRLEVDDAGDLLVHTPAGVLRQRKPVVYQPAGDATGRPTATDEGRAPVTAGYVLQPPNRVAFVVGRHDPARQLIIDPVLIYSTYLGGSGGDGVRGIAVDASGMIYVTGSSSSANFPIKNPLPLSLGAGSHAFVTKIDPSKAGADALVFSTFLGGSGGESGEGIAVDSAGNIYLTGLTSSANFPRMRAFSDTLKGSQDAFVTRLNAAGSEIQYSTFLGGAGSETAGSIAADDAGNAYLTGVTRSSDFPTRNGLQPNPPGSGVPQCFLSGTSPPCTDAFVTKIDTTKTADASLIYSTYLGGADEENRQPIGINLNVRTGDIALDPSGNIYVTGTTASSNFPVKNAFQSSNTGIAAFVTKIDPTRSGADSLLYSTYLGAFGRPLESGMGIAVDNAGRAFVTGVSTNGNFPVTSNAYRTTRAGALDAFLTVFDPAQSGDASILYSTLIGGSGFAGGGTVQGWQGGDDIAVDNRANAWITGWTRSHDFPVKNAFQEQLAGNNCKNNICYDAFVARFDLTKAGEDSLVYSSFLGGGGSENYLIFSSDGYGRIAVDAAGNAYVAGLTESADFPIPEPRISTLQQAIGGGLDAFLVKIGELAAPRLVVGNDGGVWSTTDGGGTWADHNTNLAITQFYAGSLHATNPDFAIGGSQDNGTEKWTGADAWPRILGGDGGPSAIAAGLPDTHWAISAQELDIRRTTDGGTTAFERVDVNVLDATRSIDNDNRPFLGRFEMCPANDDRFIAGTDNVWRTINFFAGATTLLDTTWQRNSPEISNGTADQQITALAFAPFDPSCNTYALGTQDGQIWITGDGGTTWNPADGHPAAPGRMNRVPDRYVTDLAFDPDDSRILYVTLSGFDEAGTPGHLFKTTRAFDPDAMWEDRTPRDASNARINIPHNTVAVDPGSPMQVFLGTDIGVWRSQNGGTTWTHMGPAVGMPNVAVYDIRISRGARRTVAFTHGRGAFKLAASTSADLSVTKTDNPDPVNIGSPLRYTVRVLNKGPNTATGVTLTDRLPGQVALVSVTPSQGTCSGNPTIVCNLGTLASGASATVTIEVTPQSAGNICNDASVTSLLIDPNTADNSVTECTTVVDPGAVKRADLSITKADDPDPVIAGNTLTYGLVVRNNGPDDAGGVTVLDTLPAGVTLVSASASQGSCSGTSTVTCVLGGIVNGGSATITIIVRAPAGAGTICNTAQVTATQADPAGGNNQASQCTEVQAPPPPLIDLSVVKQDAPDPVPLGQSLTYTVLVSNAGPATASQVTLTDTLPGGVTLVSVNTTRGNCAGSNPVACSLGPLAPGASATVTLVVTPTVAGTIQNTAVVAGAAFEVDANPGNNRALAATVVLAPAPRIEVTPASLDFGAVVIGQTRTLTVLVRNVGNGPLTVQGISRSGAGFAAVTPATPLVLSPGAVQSVSVDFAPVSPGAASGVLAVTSNDATRPSVTVPLAGTGICRGTGVAIVRNFADPEIGQLQGWLSEMRLGSEVFDQQGLRFESLQGFALVVWDDLGQQSEGLSDNDVAVFSRALNAGIPLYFIGDDLAVSTRNLNPEQAGVWTELLRLRAAAGSAGGDGTVTIVNSQHPITRGPFGPVASFPYGLDPDATTRTESGEILLGQSGADHVLVAFESAAADVRTVTQNVQASNGSGGAAGSQRKILFQNAVAWLLRLDPNTGARNLLRNAGAEAGAGSPSGSEIVGIPAWTTSPGFTAIRYGAPNVPGAGESQRIGGGQNFFAGGPANARSTAVQTVDVACSAADIDRGGLLVVLRADLAGSDRATVLAEFIGGTSSVLGSMTLGPFSGDNTTFTSTSVTGTVPPGTRSIRVLLIADRTSGSFNDAFFDNIFLGFGQAGPGPTVSRCDANTDGQVNVVDLQTAISRLLDGQPGTDLTGDGQFDIRDLQVLINVVLGLIGCPGDPTTTTTTTTTSISSTTTRLPTTTLTTTSTTTTSTTTTRPTTTTTTSTTSTTTSTTSTTTTTTSTSTSTTTTTTTTLPQTMVRGNVENPTNNQTVTGNVTISGWVFLLAGSTGVLANRVDVLLDGAVIGQAMLQIARPDVPGAFAGQGISVPGNTGFSFTWNTSTTGNGAHTLSLRAADAAGTAAEGLFEFARITVVVNNPVFTCNLFGDDFNDGNFAGWTVTAANSNWQVVSGQFQVNQIFGGIPTARHSLPAPNHFRVTVDVVVDSFTGDFFGILPSSFNQRFVLSGRTIDGLGATVLASGEAAFLGREPASGQMLAFNATNYGAVASLGVVWAADGVTLLVNGTARQTILPSTLGFPGDVPPPSLDLLELMARGTGTQIRWDNVCQSSPAGATAQGQAALRSTEAPPGPAPGGSTAIVRIELPASQVIRHR